VPWLGYFQPGLLQLGHAAMSEAYYCKLIFYNKEFRVKIYIMKIIRLVHI
jgi:hypothetical protein